MKQHISSVSRTCYFQLRRIATIRKYLTTDATAKLVTSTILSRLDYCNSLLAGLPSSSISRLQRIQNSSARLVLRKKKRDHITPLLNQLHWLPVPARITYKINTLTYKCLHGLAPAYLSDSLSLCPFTSTQIICRLPQAQHPPHQTQNSRSTLIFFPST
ncbi:hypothetical protein V1264_005925 [Littorina saxatilis]|uniref:Uncharacterized protein n=1 Tax=Littorina saxatilis TaxID=31220 RepID=A0AAN9AVV9_9CAEN